MKLNKNFKQISLTAMITSAVFVIPLAYSGTGLFNKEPVASERITTWQWALDRQKEYLDDRPMRVLDPTDDEEKNLNGFVFKAEDLKEILNIGDLNKSRETPDQVYFFMGQEGEFPDSFLHGLFRKSGHMRLIAVGMKGDKLLNTALTGTDISVFDRADPCPPMCPK
jgi:hypothetical protein